jgi:hypothetical protein
MPASFPFSDLHSFKYYVGFVKLCSPDRFLHREGVAPSDQWTLDLAFEGLRLGIRMAIEEKGPRQEFTQAATIIDDAYAAYRASRLRDGFFKLQELENQLKKVPSS